MKCQKCGKESQTTTTNCPFCNENYSLASVLAWIISEQGEGILNDARLLKSNILDLCRDSKYDPIVFEGLFNQGFAGKVYHLYKAQNFEAGLEAYCRTLSATYNIDKINYIADAFYFALTCKNREHKSNFSVYANTSTQKYGITTQQTKSIPIFQNLLGNSNIQSKKILVHKNKKLFIGVACIIVLIIVVLIVSSIASNTTEKKESQIAASDSLNNESNLLETEDNMYLDEDDIVENEGFSFGTNGKDTYGNLYPNYCTLGDGNKESSYVVINADTKYNYFQCLLGAEETFKNDITANVYIYSDDELVAQYDITRLTSPIEIRIDVSNTKLIRIVTLNPVWWGYEGAQIIMGNPALSNEYKEFATTDSSNNVESVSLVDYNIVEQDGFSTGTNGKDTYGNLYHKYCTIGNGNRESSHVVVNIEKKYAYFQCLLGAEENFKNDITANVYIYSDDELVAQYDITRLTAPIEVTIDISNTKLLRIETTNPVWWGYEGAQIIMGSPVLTNEYKKLSVSSSVQKTDSISLIDHNLVEQDGFKMGTNGKDTYGNLYLKYCVLGDGNKEKSHVVVNVEKKFSQFKCTLGAEEKFKSDITSIVNIYLDDNLVATHEINQSTKPNEIIIETQEADLLTIEVKNPVWWGYEGAQVILGNPVLSNEV